MKIVQLFGSVTLIFGACASLVEGWVVIPTNSGNVRAKHSINQQNQASLVTSKNSHSRGTALASNIATDSSLLIAAESWRQYVPLVVSCGVILDILLGSPLANAVMAPLRPPQDGEDEIATKSTTNPKERIDSAQVAQEALDRARNSMELRNYLDANKSDEQRYDEIRKQIDKLDQDLDDNLDSFEQSLKK
mmetsp:Transcript_16601/g.23398  ORF Transcript_16601/g.23398 Transcript_16601/m.23398 type:complete len:191 (+) Transcript_16601:114-686(+)